MLQVWTRRCEGSCLNVLGGGLRSIKTRLCLGLRVERSCAVARPIPEELPVITKVLGVDLSVVRLWLLGSKSVIVRSESVRSEWVMGSMASNVR